MWAVRWTGVTGFAPTRAKALAALARSWRPKDRVACYYGFIRPCLPASAERPPDGSDWVHEIKDDGYRLMVRRDGAGVRLLTRNGHDWSARFPLILEASHELQVRSCLIDGEAVACDGNGLAMFERLRRKHEARAVFLYAFDLLELDGVDLRREPIEVSKKTLASLLRKIGAGLRLNEHFIHSGEVVYRHACKMGLEGILSKRLGSPYRSGRSHDWLKMKNPAAVVLRRAPRDNLLVTQSCNNPLDR